MDFAILADLVILLLVLVLPLVSRGVERNLETFLFVMGVLSAWAVGVLSAGLIRDTLMHPIPITVAVFISGLLFKWARPHIPNVIATHRLGIHSRPWARWGIRLGVRLLVAYSILLWL